MEAVAHPSFYRTSHQSMTELPQRDRQPVTLNFITLANLVPDLLRPHAILSLLVNLALRITSYPYPCMSLDCGWKLEYWDRTYYHENMRTHRKAPVSRGFHTQDHTDVNKVSCVTWNIYFYLAFCLRAYWRLGAYFGGLNEELFSKCLNSTRGIIQIVFLVWVDLRRSNK